MQASPPIITRGGVLLPIEGNRWIMSLTGGGGDYPPTDEHGLADFVRSLPSLDIHNAVKAAKPLSPIFGYRATQNRWRHYETLSRWPDGLVVLGDAACTFNPVYGQGMTIAALAALVLQQCLRDQQNRERENALTGLGRRFQKALAKINKGPWLLATGQDVRYPGVQGARPGFGMKLMHEYMDRVTAQATRHADVRQRFLEVLHMTKPISVLFRPDILFKVLFGVRPGG
jgi:2-polyprenyl-6-methoxyphenol hydroxylase-like FAD-dependent oxidoreductase